MPNKDPAFLFYPSDFLVGTMLFSYEQKGKYIEILCLMHSKGGYLQVDELKRFLDTNDKKDLEVLNKFKKDNNGFYNQRLLDEIEKRQRHKNKQRENANKRWHPEDFEVEEKESKSKSNSKTKETTKKKPTKQFKKPTIKEIESYCKERKNNIDAEYFHDFYESKNWMIGKNKMKSWKAAVRTWEKNNYNQGNGKPKENLKENISGVNVDDDEFDWNKRYKEE